MFIAGGGSSKSLNIHFNLKKKEAAPYWLSQKLGLGVAALSRCAPLIPDVLPSLSQTPEGTLEQQEGVTLPLSHVLVVVA